MPAPRPGVADPAGVDPDPDPTVKKKPDQDPNLEKKTGSDH